MGTLPIHLHKTYYVPLMISWSLLDCCSGAGELVPSDESVLFWKFCWSAIKVTKEKQLELYRAHTPRAAASISNSLAILCMPPSVGCCRPLPTYCARLCAWAESTWWEVLIGVANKMQYLRRSWTLPNDSKHNEASFSTISTDKLYLWVAQMSRSPDLAIFVLTTDRQTDRRQTKPITLPLAHARGVIILLHQAFLS